MSVEASVNMSDVEVQIVDDRNIPVSVVETLIPEYERQVAEVQQSFQQLEASYQASKADHEAKFQQLQGAIAALKTLLPPKE